MADIDDVYPMRKSQQAGREQLTVRLPKELVEDLELIKELWTAFDQILAMENEEEEAEKPKKWKVNSVVERLISVGVQRFWIQVGGRPPEKADREKWLAAALSRLKRISDTH